MTSITFILRPSAKAGVHPGRLYLQLIHRRQVKTLAVNLRLVYHEWDCARQAVVLPANDSPRLRELQRAQAEIDSIRKTVSSIVRSLGDQGPYTVEDVVRKYRRAKDEGTLSSYTALLSAELERGGQERTARAYRTAVRGLLRFNKGQDIRLEHLNASLVRAWEKQLKAIGRSLNTISFYMRNLRAIYNKAVGDGHIPPRYESPFANVYTGVAVTPKRALSKEEVKLLKDLDPGLTLGSAGRTVCRASHPRLTAELRDALALFLFCFYARGMSFVDLAYLKKTNLCGNTLRYRRKKTGQSLEVKITPEMRAIIDRFSERTRGGAYVFPIIRDPRRGPRLQYENGLRRQNIRLKRLGKLAGIFGNSLSTHVARHSWATIAKNERVQLWVISESLGHTSEKTTQHYLASFSRPLIDKAGDAVSRAVRRAGGM